MQDNFKFSDHISTILIFLGSFGLLCFSPFLGSFVGLAVVFPTTVVGWALFLTLNISSALFNSLIFYAFLRKGKELAYKTEEYKKARELLRLWNIHPEDILISPQDWEKGEWKKKAIWIAIGTLLGGIALTQAVLSFDIVRFISQALVLLMGLVFGALEQELAKEKYSIYYLEYAEQQVRFRIAAIEEENRKQEEEEEALRQSFINQQRTLNEKKIDDFFLFLQSNITKENPNDNIQQ